MIQNDEKNQTEHNLSDSVKRKIEINRQKAISIKQSKLVSHPCAKTSAVSISTCTSTDNATIKIGTTSYKDTGGGFLLEQQPTIDPLPIIPPEEPPIFEEDRPICEKCQKTFAVSWLFDKFQLKCCDECKDPEEHKLITKTEALNTYLLKDCDLEKRNPVLPYITRKNPHNVRWGDMKLYLQIQVEEKALGIWGSLEKIEEARLLREEKKVVNKSKKYQKQLKELRMNMRSSLYDRTSAAPHAHVFDEEVYNEDEDNYTRKCKTCAYEETFEKM